MNKFLDSLTKSGFCSQILGNIVNNKVLLPIFLKKGYNMTQCEIKIDPIFDNDGRLLSSIPFNPIDHILSGQLSSLGQKFPILCMLTNAGYQADISRGSMLAAIKIIMYNSVEFGIAGKDAVFCTIKNFFSHSTFPEPSELCPFPHELILADLMRSYISGDGILFSKEENVELINTAFSNGYNTSSFGLSELFEALLDN